MTVRDQNGHVEGSNYDEEENGVGEAEKEFPNVFYDPTTDQMMQNPVVNAAGDSYDQSTVDLEGAQPALYYPNRALKAIIERAMEVASGSMRSKLRRTGESLRYGWGRLLEPSAVGLENRPLPPSFYCPIACEIIADPVIDPDGYSYEREAIVNWIQSNNVSPMTRNAVTVTELRRNNALYELIQREKDRDDSSIHGSFRRWKDSGSDTCRPDVETTEFPPFDNPTPSAPSSNMMETATAPAAFEIPPHPPAQSYPTTFGELRARRRRRRRSGFTAIGITIALLGAFIFAPYYLVVLLIFIVVFLLGWRQCALQRGAVRRSET